MFRYDETLQLRAALAATIAAGILSNKLYGTLDPLIVADRAVNQADAILQKVRKGQEEVEETERLAGGTKTIAAEIADSYKSPNSHVTSAPEFKGRMFKYYVSSGGPDDIYAVVFDPDGEPIHDFMERPSPGIMCDSNDMDGLKRYLEGLNIMGAMDRICIVTTPPISAYDVPCMACGAPGCSGHCQR